MSRVSIYKVCLRGDGLRVLEEGGEVTWGFFKNEYIRAPDIRSATAIAKARVKRALSVNSAVQKDSIEDILFTIEGVDSGVSVWRLLNNEGFVFYDSNDSDHEADA